MYGAPFPTSGPPVERVNPPSELCLFVAGLAAFAQFLLHDEAFFGPYHTWVFILGVIAGIAAMVLDWTDEVTDLKILHRWLGPRESLKPTGFRLFTVIIGLAVIGSVLLLHSQIPSFSFLMKIPGFRRGNLSFDFTETHVRGLCFVVGQWGAVVVMLPFVHLIRAHFVQGMGSDQEWRLEGRHRIFKEVEFNEGEHENVINAWRESRGL